MPQEHGWEVLSECEFSLFTAFELHQRIPERRRQLFNEFIRHANFWARSTHSLFQHHWVSDTIAFVLMATKLFLLHPDCPNSLTLLSKFFETFAQWDWKQHAIDLDAKVERSDKPCDDPMVVILPSMEYSSLSLSDRQHMQKCQQCHSPCPCRRIPDCAQTDANVRTLLLPSVLCSWRRRPGARMPILWEEEHFSSAILIFFELPFKISPKTMV